MTYFFISWKLLLYLHYFLSTLFGRNQTLTNNTVKESPSKMPIILVI